MDPKKIHEAKADISAEHDPTLKSLKLASAINMNWNEVLRIASLPEYLNVDSCKALVSEVANEVKIKSPFDSA